jgi:hypothetical protein
MTINRTNRIGQLTAQPYKITTDRANKVGRQTALTSFLAGTGLLILFYLLNSMLLAIFSLFFILIVGLINILVLILLIAKLRDKNRRTTTIKTIGLMCSNIPVVILYGIFAIILIDTARLSVKNETDQTLTNIEISGCKNITIDKLEPNESENLWIFFPDGCPLLLTYLIGGETKKETVYSYAVSTNGEKITYRIGTDKTPVDI